MVYTVTARKWRPQKFEDVVAQDHITTTLENAIWLIGLRNVIYFVDPEGLGKQRQLEL